MAGLSGFPSGICIKAVEMVSCLRVNVRVSTYMRLLILVQWVRLKRETRTERGKKVSKGQVMKKHSNIAEWWGFTASPCNLLKHFSYLGTNVGVCLWLWGGCEVNQHKDLQSCEK